MARIYSKPSQARLIRVLLALEEPTDAKTIGKLAAIHPNHVRKAMRDFLSAGKVHVAALKDNPERGGRKTALFLPGPAPEAEPVVIKRETRSLSIPPVVAYSPDGIPMVPRDQFALALLGVRA